MNMKDSVGAQDAGPEQLRAEIAQTRADLGEDVTALSEKVSPRARMSRAVDTARGGVASAASRARQAAPGSARQAGQTVRDHPVPVTAGALALAGAAATAVVTRRAAKVRAARKRASVKPWSALAGAAATALLARRRAEKVRTARTRAAAGPWFGR
jgi:hypothetical protein